MQQASRRLLQHHPELSCIPVTSAQSPVSGSPGMESSYLLAVAWVMSLREDVGEGVESPVFGKEGAAQYYIILVCLYNL